jgi:ATP-dependent DNA ligase
VRYCDNARVTLYSRNGKIISHSYVEVARALERVKSDVVLDGELVALDQHGVSRFQLLQAPVLHAAVYNVFNLQRHLISRRTLRVFRAHAMLTWRHATVAA